MYLLVSFHRSKLIIIKLHNIISVVTNPIWKNNKVKTIGTIIQMGDNHIKCLNMLTQVNKNGISIIKYI